MAWQQPESRQYFPVGRLVHGDGENQDEYEFAYIHGAIAAKEHGFHPFLGFSKLETVYRSQDLHPFFTNRLMSRKRPDFADYVARLGLEPDADAMNILARSAGMRATDSIEMFPQPVFNPAIESYQTPFLIRGIRHLPQTNQDRLLRLQPNEMLTCRPEPTNAFDRHAVQLFTKENICVGWMPHYLFEGTLQLHSTSEYSNVFVEQVNPPPAPVSHRVLCRLEARRPPGFVPFSSSTYQPIAADASRIEGGVAATA